MKKQKSLRQLATEIGVSHSYLSQVLHGKRPASDRVTQELIQELQALNGKQMVSNTEANTGLKIRFLQGSVGSSPSLGSKPSPQKLKNQNNNLKCKASDLCSLILHFCFCISYS